MPGPPSAGSVFAMNLGLRQGAWTDGRIGILNFDIDQVLLAQRLKNIRSDGGLGSDGAAAFVRQSRRNILGRGLRQPNDRALPGVVFATVYAEGDLQVLAFCEQFCAV